MIRSSHIPLGTVMLVFALVVWPQASLASWGLDGNRVVDPVAQPASVVLLPGAGGSTLLAWRDGRSGYNIDVRATSWTPRGLPATGWSASGDPVTAVTCDKWDLAAGSDGVGGAFLSWSDNRCTGYRNIYVGRLLAGGVASATWPANGVRVAATTRDQNASAIIADAAGGAYVAWEDLRGFDADLYVQRVTSSGLIASGWPVSGRSVAEGTGTQEKPTLVSDNAGGLYVAWLDRSASTVAVRLQRLTSAGATAAGWPAAGVVVATSTSALRNLRSLTDGGGGVLLAWEDPQPSGTRVLAQRLRPSGVLSAGWLVGGMTVCNTSGDRTALRVASDAAGGLLLAWQDARGASLDVFVSRVAVNGALPAGWPAQGLAIGNASGDQVAPDLVADGQGGAYLVWSDRRSGVADVYASRVAADGSLAAGWSAGGVLVCGAPGEQSAPRIMASAGDAMAAWSDLRDGGTFPSLYLMLLRSDGTSITSPRGLGVRHQNGQTFLTWSSPPDTGWSYRVYHRTTPIVASADLASATLLGSVGDSTAIDRRMLALGRGFRTFRIDSAAAPLDPSSGLFVLPAPASRIAYYAVTAQLRGSPEDRRIVPGANALVSGVQELLATPRPVYQGPLDSSPGSPDVYTLWTWNVDTPLFPAMSNRPSFPFDCGVLAAATGAVGLVRPHPRGGDFAAQMVHSMVPSEWVLGLDDYTLNEDYQTWWYGYHPSYNPLEGNLGSPSSGQVIDYTNRRALHTIRWWRATFPFDTQRHYAFGYSMGGTASLHWGISYPELFAAAMSSVGKHDFSFENDSDPLSDFNTGRIYRESLDRMWGKLVTGLPSSEGLPVYVATNDDSLAVRATASGATFVVTLSGRNDSVVGWSEKPPFYAAMELSRQGGAFYWDSRDHTGSEIPGAFAPMLDLDYLTRFRTNLSWPAFSDCSRDGNAGDGRAETADSVGTVNGYMDWDPAVVDQAQQWEVTLRTRSLATLWGTWPAPESLTVDVTPRRVQQFRPAAGGRVAWSVQRLSDGAILQRDTLTVDGFRLATARAVKVRRTGVRLRMTAVTGVLDAPPPGPRLPMLAAFTTPTRARLALSGAWPTTGPARLELFDVTGRRTRTLFAGVTAAGPWRRDAELSGLAPGVYLLSATQADNVTRRRLVLVR